MLDQFFPRMHRRYSSLRLLGPILGGFAGWLHARRYPRSQFGAICAPLVGWSSGGSAAVSAPSRRSVAGIFVSVRQDIRKMILIWPP
jgi:hypothetical protein